MMGLKIHFVKSLWGRLGWISLVITKAILGTDDVECKCNAYMVSISCLDVFQPWSWIFYVV